MSRMDAALQALENSKLRSLELDARAQVNGRKKVLGGVWPTTQRMFEDFIGRPAKVVTAYATNNGGERREVARPHFPEGFDPEMQQAVLQYVDYRENAIHSQMDAWRKLKKGEINEAHYNDQVRRFKQARGGFTLPATGSVAGDIAGMGLGLAVVGARAIAAGGFSHGAVDVAEPLSHGLSPLAEGAASLASSVLTGVA